MVMVLEAVKLLLLLEFAELLEKANSSVFDKVKTALVTAATNFKTACGTTQTDGLYKVATTLRSKNLKDASTTFGPITQFSTAKNKFGHAADQGSDSAAKKFQEFASSPTATQLLNKLIIVKAVNLLRMIYQPNSRRQLQVSAKQLQLFIVLSIS